MSASRQPVEFVGRSSELDTLDQIEGEILKQSIAGVASVFGDPGSGKSRLVAEFTERSSIGTRFQIAGYEVEQRVPLGAAANLLRSLADLKGGDERLAIEAGDLESVRVFEAIHRALRPFGPVLLVLDDLQWADETTLALCHYLVRAAYSSGQALFLLAASRPSSKAEAFQDSVDRTIAGALHHIRLTPLSADEGVRMAKQLLPRADDDDARQIWRLAKGSPFWIEMLASSETPDQGATTAASERLQRLEPDAIGVTAALAVAGTPMTLDQLERLQGWPLERIRSALVGASNRGVVVEEVGAFRIAHDLLREQAEASLPLEMRRPLHARLSEIFLSQSQDDVSLLHRSIEHSSRAGTLTPELLLRVVQSPNRRLLGEQALVSLANAADKMGFSTQALLDMHESIAELALDVGNHEAAYSRFREIFSRAAPPQRATAALRAGLAAYRMGDVARAREAVSALDSGDPVIDIARQSLEASVALWLENKSGEAMKRALNALDRARAELSLTSVENAAESLRRAYLDTLHIVFDCLVLSGRDGEANDICNEMLEVSRLRDEDYLDALITLGNHLRRRGLVARAEEVLRNAWDKARKELFPEIAMQAGYRLAGVLLAMGRITEAEEMGGESDALAERIGGLSAITAWFWADWFGTDIHRGDWRRAIEGTLSRSTAIENPHFRSALLIHAATWLSRYEGEAANKKVTELLEAARSGIAEAGCRRCASELAVTGGEMLFRVGLVKEAESSIGGWIEAHPSPPLRLALLEERTRALVALDRGDVEGLRGLESVVERADELGLWLEGIWSRIDLARGIAKRDPARAEALYREVMDSATSAGAATETMVAEQGLRRLGVRIWRRGAKSDVSELTERELEIARMAASGLTNPEIAGRIFLSRKTVERHVSNILAKLGVRNRSELAHRLAGGQFQDEGVPR